MLMECFVHLKSQFREKNPVFPVEEFPSFATREYDNVKNTLLSNFRSIICRVVAYGRLKTIFKKKFKLLALKMVVVTYDR